MTDVSAMTEWSEPTQLYLLIGRVTRAMRRHGDMASLTPGTASALAALVRSGPMRLSELASTEQISCPSMSRIVRSLIGSGYVVKSADPQDGRAALLEASESGHALIAGLTSARVTKFAEALRHLSDDERAALSVGLTALMRGFAETVDIGVG